MQIEYQHERTDWNSVLAVDAREHMTRSTQPRLFSVRFDHEASRGVPRGGVFLPPSAEDLRRLWGHNNGTAEESGGVRSPLEGRSG